MNKPKTKRNKPICNIPPRKLAYTIVEAACLLSLSRSKLYVAIRDGKFPPVTKLGARSIVTHKAIEQWLERQEEVTSTPS